MTIADFPQRPGLRQVLLEVSGVRARLGGSVRAALAVAVPSFIGLAAGFGATAALSALGAFAVVYGERRPFRTRWKAIIGYGLAFILCAAVGTLVGRDGWPIILMMTAVVVAAATWVDALREGAPGSFLLLLCSTLLHPRRRRHGIGGRGDRVDDDRRGRGAGRRDGAGALGS